MEAAKIIRKIAAYLLFVAAATWFFYEMILLMTAMYINPGEDINAYLLSAVFKPIMYVVICLAVMFVTQFTLKDKDDRYITSLMLIVFFAVGLVVSLFVLVKGITSIPNNKYCQDPSFFYYVIFPLIALCVGEISYGLFLFFMDKKEKEKNAKEQREKELSPDGIKLTKEEK